jgi:GMP reductase
MIIETDLKLDFQDVLLKPQRSELSSRSEVNLIKEFKPKYGKPFSGIPIVAANMATGTFEMLKVFAKNKMFVAIAKHNNHLWPNNISKSNLDYGFYTIGMSEEELKILSNFYKILKENKDKLKICVDIANGYAQGFPKFISKVREMFPSNVIVAGNVCTPEMTQELILAGADFVKCGIGPGCFVGDSLIKTNKGFKKIKDIEKGDYVLTHTGEEKEVVETASYLTEETLISINGLVSTKKHEYYVIEKKDKDLINADNIHLYARWVEAEELDKDRHFLIKIT